MKHEGCSATRLSPTQATLLARYEELLREVALPRGMVSRGDAKELRARHVLDSLRGVPHVPPGARTLCDLGSGAGLPGIPIAVARPDLQVTLVEPRQARIAFLELALERLALPGLSVFAGPAVALSSEFDVCVARGFGDVATTWRTARRLLSPGGCLLYWAGASFSASDAPDDALVELRHEPDLERIGPIVIMTRQ